MSKDFRRINVVLLVIIVRLHFIMKNIDILSLNQIRFVQKALVSNPPTIVICYLKFLIRVIASFVKFKWSVKRINTSVLFIEPTTNNHKALFPIYEDLEVKDYTVVNNYFNLLPKTKIYVYSLFYSYSLLKNVYRKMNDDDKRVFRYFFYNFMTTYGFYVAIEEFCKFNKNIKLIVFANDHIMQNRCFIELSLKYNIKTVYTQHASVSEKFPRLNFTYSFLDGLISFEKYKIIGGMNGLVFISGNPRFDFLKMVKRDNRDIIGIAINALDNLDLVFDLSIYIRQHTCNDIMVRPHPSLEKKIDWKKYEKYNIQISYPSKENSFEFISHLKILIANESGIHLDAALLGIPSVLYNFSNNEVVDYYLFIKSGLVKYCKNYGEVLNYVYKPIEDNRFNVKYYNAAYDTKYEGKVGSLIANFILSILKNDESNFIYNNFYHDSALNCYHYKE